MAPGAQRRLLAAAYDLDMRPLAAAIMTTKRTWGAISVVRESLRDEVFRFAVENAPAVVGLKQDARTSEQTAIVDMLLGHLIVGSDDISALNNASWASNMNLLQYAARHGKQAIVELLASAPGINVNAVDVAGNTALHLAVFGGHLGVVEFLVVKTPGTNVNARNHMRQTPLHLATHTRNAHIVEVLLADPTIESNACDVDLQTPLHYAAREGHDDIVQMLLGVPDIDMNARDKAQRTPMAEAELWGQHPIVQLLMVSGDSVQDDYPGWTTAPPPSPASPPHL